MTLFFLLCRSNLMSKIVLTLGKNIFVGEKNILNFVLVPSTHHLSNIVHVKLK